MREDISRVSMEHTKRGLPFIPENKLCTALMWSSPPLYGVSLTRFKRGLIAARRTALLPRLLLADARQFYGQTARDLTDAYDLALAFSMFAAAMPNAQFNEKVAPLLGADMPISAAALRQVAQAFKSWADNKMALGAPDEVEREYDATMQLTSACMGNQDYIAALAGAWRMIWLKPENTMGMVYAGDVFFRIDVPFFAFDHYALAHRLLPGAPDAAHSRTLVQTRLRDAFELVGDIDEARKRFEDVGQLNPEQHHEFVIPILRSRMKAHFYRSAHAAGYDRHWRALYVLNSFVGEMQRGCTQDEMAENEKALENAGAKGTSLQLMERRFARTSRKMVDEMASAPIELLWERRTAACANMLRNQ